MGTKRKNSVHIGINLSEDEREILEMFARKENRTKSDVIRDLIRSLKPKLKADCIENV